MTSQEISLPCAAEKLIPHRQAMCLIDCLLERDRVQLSGRVEARLAAGSMFLVEEHGLLGEYLIELAAQSMAAINGYDGLCDGANAKVGFLAGVDSWQCLALPEVETLITIDLQQTFEFGAIKIIQATLSQQGDVLALGELKVWEGDEFPS